LASLIPPQLQHNDLIGIAAPAGPLDDKKEQSYIKGLAYLRAKGFRIIEANNIHFAYGYLAGTDAERANEFNRLIRNPEVRAIFCVRGGYGSARILDAIDYQAFKNSPKIIIGYSDITYIQLAIFAHTGVVTFSGPMVAPDLGEGLSAISEKSLWEMTMSPAFPALSLQADQIPLKILRHGKAQGVLLGGCLPMVASLVGTPYLPDMTDAILVLEDVGESFFRMDRYFAQLKNSGILDRIAGLVLGQFVDYEQDDVQNRSLGFEEIIRHYTAQRYIPVVGDFPYGHGKTKYTLPLGAKCTLDTEQKSLTFHESR
jgi:muramoyltetrapeptide carboxypeptidase